VSPRIVEQTEETVRGGECIAGGAMPSAGLDLDVVVPSHPIEGARAELREESSRETHRA